MQRKLKIRKDANTFSQQQLSLTKERGHFITNLMQKSNSKLTEQHKEEQAKNINKHTSHLNGCDLHDCKSTSSHWTNQRRAS